MTVTDREGVATTVMESTAYVATPPTTCELAGRYSDSTYRFLKRTLDIVLTVPLLILLAPVFLVSALFIAVADGFPVMFTHKRIGRNGETFGMFKFRTMVRDAEKVLREHPELLEEYRRTYKISNDPRILRCGHFLRKTSIDELPQLFNVLRGEMTLVGPRPIVQDELEKYGVDRDFYLAMKPGCAGLWQCSGRSETTYEQRVQLDVKYFRSASVKTDLWLLARTFWAIVRRHGAI